MTREPGQSLDSGLKNMIREIRSGNRRSLAKAISLIENNLPQKRNLANQLISSLIGSGDAIRVGISGVPGVGKSTFIEVLGLYLTGKGHRVGVLTVDPSSTLTGGSILGDKVRMERLAREPAAFIRPSPSSGTLGGVTRRTREATVLLEAAGFDVILIETVGVGQSEITVSQMVDFFLLMMLPNAGDEIQGIKKGIIEVADALVINKADGDQEKTARLAKSEYESALRYTGTKIPGWNPPVMLTSGLKNRGIEDVWQCVLDHRQNLKDRRLFSSFRQQQARLWFRNALQDELNARFYADPSLRKEVETMISGIDMGDVSPQYAAEALVQRFLNSQGGSLNSRSE